MNNKKIKIGVSSCLLGEQVRFDGGHKLDHYLKDTLGRYVKWVPVCPEVESGLPVPREAMRLMGDPKAPRLIVKTTGIDLTDLIVTWAEKKLADPELQDLCGFIFKSRSPSSGMRGVKVYSAKGASITRGVGIFSRAFMDRFPLVPVEDEERLQEYSIRENFIERVFVYRRWLDLIQPGHTINELISFHTDHKYLILSHSVNHLRELGAIVSNGKKNHRSQLFDRYHHILMDGLRLMATVKKHTNVLQHMAGYLKNQLTTWEKAELQEIITRYHGGLVPLIVPITLIKHYVKKYDEPYLKRQYYLNPHSMELMLRNHV